MLARTPGTRLTPSWFERLKDQIFSQLGWLDLVVGLAVAAVLAALCVEYSGWRIPRYRAGDRAEQSWAAPREYLLRDDQATELKKAQAVGSVRPVFDLDPNIEAAVVAELRASFSRGRELLARLEQDRAARPAGRADLLRQLQPVFAQIKSDRVLDMLREQGLSKPLEDQLVAAVRQAYGVGVANTRDHVSRFETRGLVLRDIVSGEEQTVTDVSTIRDLRQARSALRQSEAALARFFERDRREIVQFVETLVLPNVAYNISETETRRRRASQQVDPVVVRIVKGKALVRRAEQLTAGQAGLLEQIWELERPARHWARWLGIFLLVGALLYLLWRYFIFHQTRHRKIRNHYVLVTLVLAGTLAISRLVIFVATVVAQSLSSETLTAPIELYYFIPAAFGAMLVMLLVDAQVAIFFSIISSLLLGVQTGSLYLLTYSVVGSLASIYSLNQYRERSALIRAGTVVGLANIFSIVAFDMISNAARSELLSLQSVGGLVSGLLAAMLASLVLPILESIFNITTDIRLLELSNLNKPILRKLALEAPGTYHHSILVGTLGEAAAEAIGANSLLVRVGAYYHDIGKIRKPEYYVENQAYCGNKHETLSPSMSSLIIASHVRDGLEMAEELKIPQKIRDMIPQHHGTKLMTYFYQKARDEVGDKSPELNESDFRYPGPKPQSKEAAILMIADQVEAASRTLADPNPDQVRELIKRLINTTIEDGQLDECDITIKELDLMIDGFQRILSGIFHHRITYPGYDFNKGVKAAPQTAAAENSRVQ